MKFLLRWQAFAFHLHHNRQMNHQWHFPIISVSYWTQRFKGISCSNIGREMEDWRDLTSSVSIHAMAERKRTSRALELRIHALTDISFVPSLTFWIGQSFDSKISSTSCQLNHMKNNSRNTMRMFDFKYGFWSRRLNYIFDIIGRRKKGKLINIGYRWYFFYLLFFRLHQIQSMISCELWLI